jgi:omega-6 fatty acid desaturase (delta-12 desaturase)
MQNPSIMHIGSFLPAHYFKPCVKSALISMLISSLFFSVALLFAIFCWHFKLYYLYPFVLLTSGMAFMGVFVLAHDCVHYSFLPGKTVMIILGHLFSLPMLYPFFAWRYTHNSHHAYANKKVDYYHARVYQDNAWQAQSKFTYLKFKITNLRYAFFIRVMRYILPLGSLLHLVGYHYNPFLFKRGYQRNNVYISYFFMATVFSVVTLLLSYYVSPLAIVYFWIAPAITSQLWMSTYTYLHHTSTETQLYSAAEWTMEKSIENTINCYLPRWLSFLHFNIDVHIPHHLSTRIPCYKLRAVNKILQQSACGPFMKETHFSFHYLLQQIMSCQYWCNKTKKHIAR